MKRLADQTLYEILEVRKDAAAAEIEAACDRVRDEYGPGSLATYTLMSPDEAALLAKRIDEARATLLDPDARARYDEALQRRDEAAAAGGRASGPGAPAVLPPAEGPGAAPVQGAPPAHPAILLAAAIEDAGAPGEVTAAVAVRRAKPILLQREVPPRAAAAAEPAAAPAVPPAPPVPVVPDGGWTGDALRQMREARGLTIQQIAERTKVTRHHIENIEDERFGALPAPVYLRGILLSLARELRLDGQKVARAYLERAAAAKPK